MTDKFPDKGKDSLKQAIAKRKTQEIMRAIEDRKVAEARGDVKRSTQSIPAAGDAKRASQSMPVAGDVKRASQSMPVPGDLKRTSQSMPRPQTVDPRRASQSMARPQSIDPRRSSQTMQSVPEISKRTTQTQIAAAVGQSADSLTRSLSSRQKRVLISSIAILLVLSVLLGTFLVVTSQPTAHAMPGLPPSAAKSPSNVLAHLKSLNVPVLNVQTFSAAENLWAAQDEIQFDVQRGDQKATFVMLGYAAAHDRVPDILRLGSDPKFKDWQHISEANILLLIAPGSSPSIEGEVISHLNQYLVAPYLPFLPTATYTPVNTPLPATQTAQAAIDNARATLTAAAPDTTSQ